MTNVPLPERSGRGTLFIFVKLKKMGMEIFVAAIVIMMSLSVATFQVIRNYKYRELTERRHRLLVLVMYVDSILVICDLIAGGEHSGLRIVVDVMLALISLQLLSSSIWTVQRSLNIVKGTVMAMTVLAAYHIMCLMGIAAALSAQACRSMFAALSMIYVLLFLLGIWYRVREVKAVMQAGTVWACLSFVMDALYVTVVMVEVMVLLMFGEDNPEIICVMGILFGATAAAYSLRIATDSLFLFYRRHERRIVESMKMSPVEVAGVGQREDDIFKDIYERVQEYFEAEKPFLNGDLTINDIVAVVFTNKLYISRAISQYTGRNFCQYVNYHRVMYSVECFRRNPELKIAELWPMCGFNTIVSFNMAFRLFMGENPSDWCRKEKIRIFRKGK